MAWAGRAAWVGLAGAMALAACGEGQGPSLSDGGFTDPGDPSVPAFLKGRVLTAAGVPAPGVDLYVVKDDGTRHLTQSASDGRFSVLSAPSGRVKLVLNDRQGNGLVRDQVLFSDGENDLGDLFLDLLERSPVVVDLRGVGFEERISRDAGGYVSAIFNADGSKAYAARQPPGSASWDILELDTATGTEQLIGSVPELDTTAREPLRLNERVLAVDTGDYSRLFDVRTRQLLRGTGLVTDEIWTQGHFLFAVERFGSLGINGRSVYEMRLLRWDLTQEELTANSTASFMGGKYIHELNLFTHDESTAVYAGYRSCPTNDSPELKCTAEEIALEQAGGRKLYRIDLASLQQTELAVVEDFARVFTPGAVIAGTPRALYLLHDASPLFAAKKLSRVDLTTGQRTVVREQVDEYTDDRFIGLWASEDRTSLVVHGHDADATPRKNLKRYDIATKTWTPIPVAFEAGGQPEHLCQSQRGGRPWCQVTLAADGRMRITDELGREEGQFRSVIADYDGQGQLARTLVFAVGEQDRLPSTALRGEREAFATRDPGSQFWHVFSGKTTEATLTKRTFLSGDHRALAFDPAGEHLLYFTRDPLSGVEQLFRVAWSG